MKIGKHTFLHEMANNDYTRSTIIAAVNVPEADTDDKVKMHVVTILTCI